MKIFFIIILSIPVGIVILLALYLIIAIVFDLPARRVEWTLHQTAWKKYENTQLGIGL